MPDYDYIEGEDDQKTITSDQHEYSEPRIDIYNIPEGDTMKFINQLGSKMLQSSGKNSQVPGPYEIPKESFYEDPGVQKEKIYEWFDKKKFRKLTRAEIK